MPCTDQQLLALLDTEPENAMAVLIETYSGLLWKICREYVSNEEDVKDCVNETFSEFYLHRERFDPQKGTIKGYLAAIARRTAIHCYQKEQRQSVCKSVLSDPDIPDPAEDFLDREELLTAMATAGSCGCADPAAEIFPGHDGHADCAILGIAL